MIYTSITDLELFDLGVLSKPTVRIGKASYDWERNVASIELLITEEGARYRHSRSFEIPADGEVTSADVEQRVKEFLGENFKKL